MERATDGLAVLSVVTGLNPAFYTWLSDVSSLSALLMPILGCTWLGVQIWSRLARDK